MADQFPIDPLAFGKELWPHVTFFKEQKEVIYSVAENKQTFVPAGNMLGKDFTAAFIILWFFITRRPCRVVTTSAKDDHLRVLWGEIGNFVNTSKISLDYRRGGLLILNHQDMRKVINNERCPLSYVTGLVASPDSIAAMQGHHIANRGDGISRTLFVTDEASSVRDEYFTMAKTWANRLLILGNTWPCDNFFRHAIKGKPGTEDRGGDIPRPTRVGQQLGDEGYYRKVIRIKAEDSPNVRFGIAQRAIGIDPTNELILPGVKSYFEYLENRATWDKMQQCVSLDADFYEGAEVVLYPSVWLNEAEQRALELQGKVRKAKAIGIDPAEGGDKTAMAAIDELGLIELVSKKTPDTSVITSEALAFMRKHNVPADKVCFDSGGGGKQHADRLRAQGYRVKTVAFGERVLLDLRRVPYQLEARKDNQEDRYVFVNRRAEMYFELRLRLDPSLVALGPRFAIPSQYSELRRQLSPMPLLYDGEGRIRMLPKNKRNPDSDEKTLTEMIGCSPDEADALVIALHIMTHKSVAAKAGALI